MINPNSKISSNLVYFLEDRAYINITNACTNSCTFCIRDIKDDVVGANMWLDNENIDAQDVIAQINLKKDDIKDEIVFCGYGEPLIKFEEVKKVAQYIKENLPNVKVRINTNGHGNFIHKKNIVPELAKLIDSISISLNAQDEDTYNEICNPSFEGAFEEVLNFAQQCVDNNIDTTMSVVSGYKEDVYSIDVPSCAEIAQSLGAKLRVREWIEQGY